MAAKKLPAKKKPAKKKAPLSQRESGRGIVRKEKIKGKRGKEKVKGKKAKKGAQGKKGQQGKKGSQGKKRNNTKLRKGRVLVRNGRGEWVDKIRSDAAKAQWYTWTTKGGEIVKPRKGKMLLADARQERDIYELMMQAELNGKLEETMQSLADDTGQDIGECYTDYYFSPKAAEFMG